MVTFTLVIWAKPRVDSIKLPREYIRFLGY